MFISIHCIPENCKYVMKSEAAFVSGDNFLKIMKGTELRVKILSSRIDVTSIACVGTIDESNLGVLKKDSKTA